ncbi:hypothetical protein A3F34_02035 [Candidatus Roizmanbacteria bacterium RIFCSPHIGHO2_12_FULL_44_10]|uniref:Uncharacterized protein n=1 Tax=Candidatus Roizmanbacteria bacterium RIFCSPHIGHO2_12_FULL_44_10 TaxID=1802054 RepID=A0A1F7I6B7_9BACT|nr:MAG: hypothetical protein A3F34_02035 [Candidatus Roizmanbacteria bacterium RIFCSPHIGHO2_12_FULL_44_10]
MAQETSPASNREAVVRYYNAAEKGYWGDLGGVCHYGFSPVDHDGPFDMASAQIEMERILGRTLDLPPRFNSAGRWLWLWSGGSHLSKRIWT